MVCSLLRDLARHALPLSLCVLALLLQLPIGWLVDRFNRYAVLIACAAGGAIGAATGNTRRGLAAGAAGGGVLGGMRRADSNRQQEQWAQQEAANYQRNRNNWNRAFIACMEARGYTVR